MQQIGTAVARVVRRSQETTSEKSVSGVWEKAATVAGMDKKVFAELMNGLWAGCGRTTLPDQITMRVWYFCLHDLSETQLANAIARYLTERSKEYLTVQLIRELSGQQIEAEQAGLLAWDLVLDAVRIVGSYAIPEFQDAAISQTISNLGGWDWFCDQNPDQLRKFVRATFLKTYSSLSKLPRLEPAKLRCLIDKSGGTSQRVLVGPKVDLKRIE